MHSMWVITIYFVLSVHQEIKRFFASHHLLQDRFRPYKERTLKLSNGGMPCEIAYERKSRSLLYTCLTTPERESRNVQLIAKHYLNSVNFSSNRACRARRTKKEVNINSPCSSFLYYLSSPFYFGSFLS